MSLALHVKPISSIIVNHKLYHIGKATRSEKKVCPQNQANKEIVW
jgi:hypothetical protein